MGKDEKKTSILIEVLSRGTVQSFHGTVKNQRVQRSAVQYSTVSTVNSCHLTSSGLN